jgi:hypothetical protein
MINRIFLLLTTLLITLPIFAQTLFNSTQKPTDINTTSGPNVVVSPAEFEAELAQIEKQKQAESDRQFNQIMTHATPPPPPTEQSAIPEGTPTQAITVQPSPPTVSSTSTTIPAASSVTPGPAAGTPTQSKPVYTGFGATKEGTGGQTVPQQKSSNIWTIHY